MHTWQKLVINYIYSYGPEEKWETILELFVVSRKNLSDILIKLSDINILAEYTIQLQFSHSKLTFIACDQKSCKKLIRLRKTSLQFIPGKLKFITKNLISV